MQAAEGDKGDSVELGARVTFPVEMRWTNSTWHHRPISVAALSKRPFTASTFCELSRRSSRRSHAFAAFHVHSAAFLAFRSIDAVPTRP
jgi:hypothetical protein